MKKIVIVYILSALVNNCFAQSVRQKLSFDDNWFFAFGHPYDKGKDYNTGTSYFTYFAKARYGADGAAAINFDHRAWRKVDLPHDWAVEMSFDAKASHSHGYKAVGPGFPDVSVGWYRKSFSIEQADLGKQLFLDFDGVSRDAQVWVNGHYLGKEPSGYQSFSYNITDILNYGGNNVVAVRADVTMEEGWYYEGAGIYRHVWLRKTPDLHIPKYGSFVYCAVNNKKASVTIEAEIENKGNLERKFTIKNQILDAEGKVIVSKTEKERSIHSMNKTEVTSYLVVETPILWSLERPYRYTMLTQILDGDKVIDTYKTPFGIRTIKFDANKGFFLNGKHVKLKGTNNHQDHAGVGAAMPDELIRWRLQQLKDFGSNAIRSSHNPPTPKLLSICDEMGMLVINENRLMGTTDKALHELERLIKRDRNHPSVIAWSIGNEEWGIEGNEIGIRMTTTMQNFAKSIDPTRPINVAVSGGWGYGSSTVVEIMGYNYLVHGDTDKHHAQFPHQPSIGTEEGSTYTTRGVYFVDDEKHYKTAYDVKPLPHWYTIQEVWKHYAQRDYLSGMFIWTGFDYRGEPTPYSWPSVTSYFGMMDLCGFPKDNVFYLKSWWQEKPVLHLFPHWNWQGKEGDTIDVWVYSNCEELKLELNGREIGRKSMKRNGHLNWKVPYEAGSIQATAYTSGKEVLRVKKVTTGSPQDIRVSSSKTLLQGTKDIAMLTVEVLDENGYHVPTADNQIYFEIEGPGKIIGVGNGNPTSLEKEVFIDDYKQIELPALEDVSLNDTIIFDWSKLSPQQQKEIDQSETLKTLQSSFHLDSLPSENQRYTLYYKHVGNKQQIYLNGKMLSNLTKADDGEAAFVIDSKLLLKGKNELTILTSPFVKKHQWDNPNIKPGVIQVLTKAEKSKRKLFNGLAQVIVQSTGLEGEIALKASSPQLNSAKFLIKVQN